MENSWCYLTVLNYLQCGKKSQKHNRASQSTEVEIAPSLKIVGLNAGQGFVLRLKKMAVGAPASRQITATNWTGGVDNKVEARVTWTKIRLN